MSKFKYACMALIALALFAGNGFGIQAEKSSDIADKSKDRMERFEKQLDDLRVALRIPGMSAAIVRDQQIVWSKGFGHSDYENRIPATPETLYEVASLTKTFASTLMMQLVEQGRLDLNDSMSKYLNDFKNDAIKVRHVFTHTAHGNPGDGYQYNGNLFAYLTRIIEKTSGKPFRDLLVENILEKLNMTGTVPGNDAIEKFSESEGGPGADVLNNYKKAMGRMARSYKLYGDDQIILTENERRGMSASNGLISNVLDLAQYDIAIDRNALIKKETQEKAWTAALSNGGKILPYGYGWFVQNYRGLKLVWHYGYLPDFYSSLLLKVPEKNMTFILLANSDAASSPFKIGMAGNILNSPFACLFMRLFVFEDHHGAVLPQPNWALKGEDLSAEISRLEKQGKGYRYDCEAASREAIRAWLAAHRASARKEIEVDPKIYDYYVGQYEIRPGSTLTITKEGGRLFAQGSRRKIELFSESETDFFSKVVDAQIVFMKDDGGKVFQLKFRSGREEMIAKKLK